MFARMLGLAEAAQPFNSITATPPFISDLDLDIIADELPEPVMSSLGQTTKDDRLLYYWAARSFFTGAGTIVDGGALVGSTTTAFAEGLLANAMASKPEQSILVYDLFTDANDSKKSASQSLKSGHSRAPRPGSSHGTLPPPAIGSWSR